MHACMDDRGGAQYSAVQITGVRRPHSICVPHAPYALRRLVAAALSRVPAAVRAPYLDTLYGGLLALLSSSSEETLNLVLETVLPVVRVRTRAGREAGIRVYPSRTALQGAPVHACGCMLT